MLAEASGRHFAGLAAAARCKDMRFSSKMQRSLRDLDVAFNFVRHATCVRNDLFIEEVAKALRDANEASALLSPAATQKQTLNISQVQVVENFSEASVLTSPAIDKQTMDTQEPLQVIQRGIPKISTHVAEKVRDEVPHVLLDEHLVQVPQSQACEVVKQVPKEQELVEKSGIPKFYTQVSENVANAPCVAKVDKQAPKMQARFDIETAVEVPQFQAVEVLYAQCEGFTWLCGTCYTFNWHTRAQCRVCHTFIDDLPFDDG